MQTDKKKDNKWFIIILMPYTLWRVRLISKQARTEACAGCSVHKGPAPAKGHSLPRTIEQVD